MDAKQSEELFRVLVENMTQGVMYQQADGIVLYANPAAERILGLPIEQLMSASTTEPNWRAVNEDGSYLPVTDLPPAICLRTGKAVERFVMGVQSPGRPGSLWISVSSIPIYGDGDDRPFQVMSTFEDITARRRAEQNYRSIFAEMLDGFALHEFIFDEDNNPSDYRFLAANPAFERMTGLVAEDIVGRTVREVIPGIEQSWIDTYGKVVKTGEPVTFENYAAGLNKYFAVRAFRTSPNQFATIFIDVTETRTALNDLQQSEEALRKAQHHAHVGSWNWDLKTDKLVWSEEMYRIFGLPKEEFTGQLPDVVARSIHPEDRPAVEAWNEAARRNDVGSPLEFRVLLPDGSFRWVWAGPGEVDMDEYGQPTRLSGIVQDISEQKRSDADRQKLEAQLRQAQKMEAVGRLAGGVAHDFNNMLSVIVGSAELALELAADESRIRNYLEEIRKAADRSAALTQQLLAFARSQTIAPRVIRPNRVISSMTQMLKRLVGENIDLAWIPGTGVWNVKMDPAQLDQVFANLLVNARDAIDDVGKITIETSNATIDREYQSDHPEFRIGDFVKLTVSDDGRGMDRDTVSKVFEPFFTTKGAMQGTGLGLSTVYGIVTQNEGFIHVYSEPGQGTTFSIYLPRQIEDAEDVGFQSGDGESPDLKATILVVEDEPAILRLITDMLSRRGYEILTSGGPSEAIELASTHDGHIDLLITDVVLPEMNGRDLARRLKEIHGRMTTLFMSGYTANVIAHHGVLEEGVHFIEKPFSSVDLATKVRAALENSAG